ncbi:MAG: chemotaxis response regulator protein-glutamate methylesterase [Verrucomicrobiales bacterium]|nr:chemotaxis response regulator protein-glutamate methylesterase [Verrucomicrobiales bacterium]
MRIAIVNDAVMAVEALRRALAHAPEHRIAWIAHSGVEAVEKCARDRPDLILMDLFMPRMGGVEATRRIMAQSPCAIVVVTGSVQDQAGAVFEAMGAGALDAVNTPALGGSGQHADVRALLAKVATIDRLLGRPGRERGAADGRSIPLPRQSAEQRLVVMGASAGGPAAIAKILSGLRPDFPAAVAVVQHVDAVFAEGLAQWLAQQSRLPVRLAREGDPPEPGVVLLAGRAMHLVLNAAGRWSYQRAPLHCTHRPSVDVFFQSVSRHWKGRAVGVLLTGMGRDGAAGLRLLRERGHATIAQDRASCAVYGMPKAAVELDAATEILALDKIAARLTNIFTRKPGV